LPKVLTFRTRCFIILLGHICPIVGYLKREEDLTMFDDINEKLKIFSWINLICWGLLAFFIIVTSPSQTSTWLYGEDTIGFAKFIAVAICLVNGYVSSAILNGFAKIIEYTYTSANNSIRCMEKLERIEKTLDNQR
jgi:hypothetical protein